MQNDIGKEAADNWTKLVYEPNKERVEAYIKAGGALSEPGRCHNPRSCDWCQDEFCTNANCPIRGDYCPVVDYPSVCRFDSRGRGAGIYK